MASVQQQQQQQPLMAKPALRRFDSDKEPFCPGKQKDMQLDPSATAAASDSPLAQLRLQLQIQQQQLQLQQLLLEQQQQQQQQSKLPLLPQSIGATALDEQCITPEQTPLPVDPLPLSVINSLAPAVPALAKDTNDKWKNVIETAIQSIVSIRYCVTSTFDTYHPGTYTATGFIVDVENAIILTNKHVVTDAPFSGKISFRNSEEVEAWVIYRDPVHDFGFLQFDKKSVRFQKLTAIELRPDLAKVGMEIKVPGADAGEKLSILTGIIARLDRPCANYGKATYCDFNTFYIQASSNTSGGSSGSPVINIDGKAVALNAGGSTVSASSFFLPLPRVKRALEFLQRGIRKVPRGTVQVEFSQKTFDDCRRMGLPLELETRFRGVSPDLNGLLSVRTIIPQGSAHGILQPGDLVLQVNHRYVNHFIDLAEIMDDNVGQQIHFQILRQSKIVDVEVSVQDLHDISPSQYLVFGGDVFHSLSYQLARSYYHPVGGVFLAKGGNIFGVSGIPNHSMIVSVNHRPVRNMDEFISVLNSLPDGKRVPVRYYVLSKKNVELIKVITIDRIWDVAKVVKRDDYTGKWFSTPLPLPPAAPAVQAQHTKLQMIEPGTKYREIAAKVMPSLVYVEFRSGFGIDGVNISFSEGIGFVLDTERGIVVTDRYTVPSWLGRTTICIGNKVILEAEIIMMDPLHNLVFLRYNPAHVSENAACLKPLAISPDTLNVGDTTYLVSQSPVTHLAFVRKAACKSKGHFFFGEKTPPQHRTINFDSGISLVDSKANEAGVLVDKNGDAQALWLVHRPCGSFMGTAIEAITPLLQMLQQGQTPYYHTVDGEFLEVFFWKARECGLSEEWLERIFEANGQSKYSVVAVRRTVSNTETSQVLKEGDLILACNGQVVSRAGDLTQVKPHPADPNQTLNLTIFRDGQELQVTVPLVCLTSAPSVEAVVWAGAVVQEPHRPTFLHIKHVPRGVYISVLYTGSPAHRDGLTACLFVTEVNGKPTPDLKSFLAAVDEDPSKLTTVNFMRKGWADRTVYGQVKDLRESQSALLGGSSGGTLGEGSAPVPQLDGSSNSNSAVSSQQDLAKTIASTDVGDGADAATETPLRAEMITDDPPHHRASSPTAPVPESTTLGFPPLTDKKSFRIMTMSYDLAAKVVTVETDPHYFPTWRVQSLAPESPQHV
ncbi:hypothetical protein RI367_000457 [Sorochytrium milnesiophthora]